MVFGIIAIILGLLGAASSSIKAFHFAALKSGHVTATGDFSVKVDGKETVDADIGAEMLELMKKSSTSNFRTRVFLMLLAVLLFTRILILNMLWMILFPVILLIWLHREIIKEDISTGYGWHLL